MEMAIVPSSSYFVIATTTAVNIPSLRFTVPDHWTVEYRRRLAGKSAGSVVRRYCEPETGRKFYSLKSVERYMAASDWKKVKNPLSEMLELYKEKLLHNTKMARSTPNEFDGCNQGMGMVTVPSSSYSVIATTTAVNIPSLRFTVPDHWIVEDHRRLSGKTADFVVRCYCEPETGRKFYSLKTLERYLAATDWEKPLSEMLKLYKEKRLHKKRSARSLKPPDGWIVKKQRRTSGCSRGKVDKIYTEPETGFKFNSLRSVERYLATSDEKTLLLKSMRADRQELHRNRDVAILKEAHRTTAANIPSLCGTMPGDWIIEDCRRKSGVNAGRLYRCYCEPETGHKFYSLRSVRRYMEKSDWKKPIESMARSTQPECHLLDYLMAGLLINCAVLLAVAVFYIEPETGHKFNSVIAVERYLAESDEKTSILKSMRADSEESQENRDVTIVAQDSSTSRTVNVGMLANPTVEEVPSSSPSYDDVIEEEMFGKEVHENKQNTESEIESADFETAEIKLYQPQDSSIKKRLPLSRMPPNDVQKLKQVSAENELPSRSMKESISKNLGLNPEKVKLRFRNARYRALQIIKCYYKQEIERKLRSPIAVDKCVKGGENTTPKKIKSGNCATGKKKSGTKKGEVSHNGKKALSFTAAKLPLLMGNSQELQQTTDMAIVPHDLPMAIVKEVPSSSYNYDDVNEKGIFGTNISEEEQLYVSEKNIADVEKTEVKLSQRDATTKRPSSFRMPPSIVQKLRQVFSEHELPSGSVKESLSKQLGLSYQKVNHWFRNARCAALKKRKMIMADSQELQQKNNMATVAHGSSTTNLSMPDDWIMDELLSSTPNYDDLIKEFYYEHGIQHKFQSPKTVEMCNNESVESTTTPKANKSRNSTACKKNPGSEKTKTSDPIEKNLFINFTNAPTKIKWFLTDAEGDTWSPFVDGKMVPDSIKRQWVKSSFYLLST